MDRGRTHELRKPYELAADAAVAGVIGAAIAAAGSYAFLYGLSYQFAPIPGTSINSGAGGTITALFFLLLAVAMSVGGGALLSKALGVSTWQRSTLISAVAHAIGLAMGFPPAIWFENAPGDGTRAAPAEDRDLVGRVGRLFETVRHPRTVKPYTDAEVARMSAGVLTREEVEGIRTGAVPDPTVGQAAALAAVTGGTNDRSVVAYLDSILDLAGEDGRLDRLRHQRLANGVYPTTEARILERYGPDGGRLPETEGLHLVLATCDELEARVSCLCRSQEKEPADVL